MEILTDMSQRASVDSTQLEWQQSPLKGVERRMLERMGGEVARATSLVKFEDGASFSPHTHHGGEEYLVLDGVFTDEEGDHPKGSYVRNPVGSTHTPSSAEGCIIFVKLHQMPKWDQEARSINIHDGQNWQRLDETIELLDLHRTRHETVQIIRLKAGAETPLLDYPAGAELFVLEGEFSDDEASYGPRHWLRLPPGSHQKLKSETDCLIYQKTGHLTDLITPPGQAGLS